MDNGLQEFLYLYLATKRGPKPRAFYKNLIHFYNLYPKTARCIIFNLHKIGCWKDYLKLLENSDNEELNTSIVEFLVSKLDDETYRDRLAIVLPREGSYYDNKLNFVDKICKIMFPSMKKFLARKKYRILVNGLSRNCRKVDLNLKNVTDSTKDSLDYSKFKTVSMIRVLDQIDNDNAVFTPVTNELFKRYKSLNFWNFCREINKDGLNYYTKQILEGVMYTNYVKYVEELMEQDLFHPEATFLVDMSINSCSGNRLSYIIGVIILNSYLNKPDIFINFRSRFKVELTGSIFDWVEEIKSNILPSVKIHYENVFENAHKTEELFVITTKPFVQPPPNPYTTLTYWIVDNSVDSLNDSRVLDENTTVVNYLPTNTIYNLEFIDELIGGYSYTTEVYYPKLVTFLIKMFVVYIFWIINTFVTQC